MSEHLSTETSNQPELLPPAPQSQAETGAAPVDVLFCNLDSPPKMIAIGGISAYNRFMDKVRTIADDEGIEEPGYTSMEITPSRRLVADIIKHGDDIKGPASDRPFAMATHQSWAPSGVEIITGRKLGVQDLGSYAILISERASLDTLERISPPLNSQHTVVFPDKRGQTGLPDFAGRKLGAISAQISPDMFKDLSPDHSVGSMYENLLAGGVDRIVIDNHHLIREAEDGSGYRLQPQLVLGSVEASGIPVSRLHLSAGRSDKTGKGRAEQTGQDLDLLLKDPDQARHKTKMGEVLEQSYRIWRSQLNIAQAIQSLPDRVIDTSKYSKEHREWAGRIATRLPITVEVTSAGLATVRPDMKPGDFERQHATLATHTRAMFNAIESDIRQGR